MAWFQVDFYSNCLHRRVPLNVVMPAEDAGLRMPKAPKGDYKTLYLLHGYYGSTSDWLLNGDVNLLSIRYNAAIVMPSGNNDFYVDAVRSGKDMSTFISQELVDFTRRMFPLSRRREDTMIGGLSMGGFGTLYNAFRHSDVFGHAIALSAPAILEEENVADITDVPNPMGVVRGYYKELFGEDLEHVHLSEYNPRVQAKLMVESGRPRPDLYIACGWNDVLRKDNRALSEYLTSIGVEHVYEEGPGSHDWDFWKPFLVRGLDHCIPDPPEEPKNFLWIDKD